MWSIWKESAKRLKRKIANSRKLAENIRSCCGVTLKVHEDKSNSTVLHCGHAAISCTERHDKVPSIGVWGYLASAQSTKLVVLLYLL